MFSMKCRANKFIDDLQGMIRHNIKSSDINFLRRWKELVHRAVAEVLSVQFNLLAGL